MTQKDAKSTKTGFKKHLKLIIIVLAVAGGIWLWEDVLEDRLIPKRFGVVNDGLLYRSGAISEPLIEKVLRENDIRLIVDMTADNPDDPRTQAEKRIAAELGVAIERCPLGGDGTGDPNNYARALIAIARARQEGTPTLVHCAAGSQRTGGVIAFYRLLLENQDPDFVVREMRRYDWKPDEIELSDYINAHIAFMARRLVQEGYLEDIPSPLPQISP